MHLDAADIRRRMLVLWLVVFIDLLGFGILIPLVPFFGLRLGLSAGWVTFIISLHSLFQFFGAPLLGRLSDRYGRRPVLALSMLGHAAAYGLLAFAHHPAVLIASRMLSGLTSGNLAAAYAYVTDIHAPDHRAAALAKVSAAFALGFALGPVLGGLLANAASPAGADLVRPAIAAALLSLVALFGILKFLPESHRRTEPSAAAGDHQRPGAFSALRDTTLAALVALALLVFVCASMRESILAIWLHEQLQLPTRELTLLFTVNGLTVACMQFLVTGRLIERVGELNAARTGIACYALSWIGLVLSHDSLAAMFAVALGACGTAFFGTSVQALAARRATPITRGAVMGLYQASASLARFAGAAMAGSLFLTLGANAPFEIGAIAMLPAMALTLIVQRRSAAASPPDRPL